MSIGTTANGEVRLARRALSRIELYLRIVVWMRMLGLSRGALQTYAAFYALLMAGREATASAAAFLTGKSLRSVRRDVAVIDKAGLWIKQARHINGRRTANKIILIWRPCMPESLRGEPLDDVARSVESGRGDGGVIGRFAVTIPSRLKISALDPAGQAKASHDQEHAPAMSLPADLLAELDAAVNGRGDECLRVMRKLTATMPLAAAKAATVDAVRRLIARAQRGPITNPAGLLCSHIGPEAIAALPLALEELTRLEENVLTSWNAIAWARSGFLFLRSVRVFENHEKIYAQHHRAWFGESECLSLKPLEAPLCDFLAEARQLHDQRRGADDLGASRSGVDDHLFRLEQRVDQHLSSTRAPTR